VETPVKDVYVYLDYSRTIVNKDDDRASRKLAAMLRETLSADSGLVVPDDVIHIATFGQTLSAETESLARENAWNQAISDFERPQNGDLKTQLAGVFDSIRSIAEGMEPNGDDIKVFIIASDFVHDPDNNLSVAEGQARTEIENAISRLEADHRALFIGDNARCFLFLLKVAPRAQTNEYRTLITSMAEDCLRDLRTKLDANISIDGIDGSDLARKIRGKLLRWVSLRVVSFESNQTSYPDIVLEIMNPNFHPVELEDIGVSLNADGQPFYPDFFERGGPVSVLQRARITLETKDLPPDYKSETLFLTPKMAEVPAKRFTPVEVSGIPENQIRLGPFKTFNVFSFGEPLLAIHPKVTISGLEDDDARLVFSLYKVGQRDATLRRLTPVEQETITPFMGGYRANAPLFHREEIDTESPKQYRVLVALSQGSVSMTGEAPLLAQRPQWYTFLYRTLLSVIIVYLICLLLVGLVPTVISSEEWGAGVSWFQDQLFRGALILAPAGILLTGMIPDLYALLLPIFPAYTAFALVLKLGMMFLPKKLDAFRESDKETPVEVMLTGRFSNVLLLALVLGGLSYFLIKTVVFS